MSLTISDDVARSSIIKVAATVKQLGFINIRDFAPAGMTGMLGDGTVRTVGSVLGVNTLNALAAVSLNGATPFAWVKDSRFGLTDAVVASYSMDSLAWQSGMQLATSQQQGGRVVTPGGLYMHNRNLLIPSPSNGSLGYFPDVELIGDGMAQSRHQAMADFGAGKSMITAMDRSPTAPQCGTRIKDLGLAGFSSAVGTPPAAMGGIATTEAWLLDRVQVSGFYFGIGIRQDHQRILNCKLSDNYYNILFQNPAAGDVDRQGDQIIQYTGLDGCKMASVACEDDASINANQWLKCHMGGGPYAIYRVAGPNPNNRGWMAGNMLDSISVEACGNGCLFGENGDKDLIVANIFDLTGLGVGLPDLRLRLPGRKIVGFRAGQIYNNTFIRRDITGRDYASDAYTTVSSALIEGTSTIQGNRFENADNLVKYHTAAIPALKSPYNRNNTYTTSRGSGRFMDIGTSIAAKTLLSEGGDRAVIPYNAQKVLAGIAEASGAAGGVVPVTSVGEVVGTKPLGVIITKGDRLFPSVDGWTNAGFALASAAGFAFGNQQAADADVTVVLSPAGMLAQVVGAAIAPNKLANLAARYAADRIQGTADAAALAAWADSSGNAVLASQPVAANQPIYRSSRLAASLPSGGSPVIQFDGKTDFLYLPLSSSQALSCLVVASSNSFSTGCNTLLGSNGGGGFALRVQSSGMSLALESDGVTGISASSGNTPIGSDEFHVYAATYANPGLFILMLDGVILATGTSSVVFSAGHTFNIGRQANGNLWNGTIAEVDIYTGAKSSTELQAVSAWLMKKYGVF